MPNKPIRGTQNMTIAKVETNQVYGHIDRVSGARIVSSTHYDFVGTLEGDKLVFTGPGRDSVQLTISGLPCGEPGSRASATISR